MTTDQIDATSEAAMKRTAIALTAGLTSLTLLLITGATAPAQNGGLVPQERIPDRVARNIARPLRRLSTTWPYCRNVPSARQYSAAVRYTLFTGMGVALAGRYGRTAAARACPDLGWPRARRPVLTSEHLYGHNR